jgi:nitrite reductase/ring-hydroxylating ferredoxin subunit
MMDDGLDPKRWRDVYAEDELAPGEMVNVDIGRHSILLTRTPNGISALQNVCPHERCYLHLGTLEDGAIVCAGHQWCFDASTGSGIRPRNAKLSRYDVCVRDGRIRVALPAPRRQTQHHA